jgi:hypothetical protein
MSRYIAWTADLSAGALARSGQVNSDFSQFDAAMNLVEAEMNRTIRFTDGTPGQTDYQVADTAAQRANRVVGFDAAGKAVTLSQVFNWRGAWAPNTLYKVNDIVKVLPVGSISLCTTQHTSSAAFATDAGTMWSLMIDLTDEYNFVRHFQIITNAQSPFAAAAGSDLMIDVSGGPVTIVLPAAPQLSDQPISLVHVNGNIATNPITVSRNGQNIMSLAQDMTVSDTNAALELAFSNATLGWRLVRGT